MSGGEFSRAMRTFPVPCVSVNTTLLVLSHAFMCRRMRARRSAGGLSRNCTDSLTPETGHRRPITTASRRGPPRRPIGVRSTGRPCWAFDGLICTARRAAEVRREAGRDRGIHTIRVIRPPNVPAPRSEREAHNAAVFQPLRTHGGSRLACLCAQGGQAVFQRIRQYDLIDVGGRFYRPRAYGDARTDGMWDGWLVFFPLGGGPAIATDRETTQATFQALTFWA